MTDLSVPISELERLLPHFRTDNASASVLINAAEALIAATKREAALRTELDKVWGIGNLVDINVEEPSDYLLVLGELIATVHRARDGNVLIGATCADLSKRLAKTLALARDMLVGINNEALHGVYSRRLDTLDDDPTPDTEQRTLDAAGQPLAHYRPSTHSMTRCQSDCDGDCTWSDCPQLRDGEPEKTGRHCPLDREPEGD